MPDADPAALAFLLSRRSVPAQALTTPMPDRDTLTRILTAAARSPDHGKLEPFRFVVLGRDALGRIAGTLPAHGARLGVPADKIAKAVATYGAASLAVVVVHSPKPSDKVPAIEQTYATGGVCLALVNASLAAGFGATWLSGWFSHDATFVQHELGLAPLESVAGIVHIGTATSTPPDRPRPDLNAITDWSRA
ncbi:Nitroreductase [Loktanella fryxellensis]|uniref:Putative NAD(P)H nitroreductase n=1 Tax=Loktanella fryxellensis TaxID=245187 RepID=A0A1H8EV29_9RHOB|nr:nitroreductase family protein [Loktanella fryxellensis]SEN22598.1 Nitroreductase [Loktanella fryxellensis]